MAWEEYSVQLLQASTTCFCLTRMTKLNIWINQQTDRPARKKVSTSQERGRERSTKTASTERTPRESVSKSDTGSIPPTPAPNKNQHQQSRFITGLNWLKFTNYWQPSISVAVLWCVLTRWPQGAFTVTTANHIMVYSLKLLQSLLWINPNFHTSEKLSSPRKVFCTCLCLRVAIKILPC